MNEPVSEKDLLLMMLTKMNEQLEELDSVIEASFSDLRGNWFREEAEKLAACRRGVSSLENRLKKADSPNSGDFSSYPPVKKQTSTLKLDISFH